MSALALACGYSISVVELAAEADSDPKIRVTFDAVRAQQNPVKALDDAIDLVHESQTEMTRKELIEWAQGEGLGDW